ncbi:AAA family ATPase [Pontibacter qinzhouensis]|uniref:AAA family ATPase n=1 Tax=Pontibacter qinzhouensis TaxID=2603253 RepID=A0A5C8IV31_9BACT|nr:AAA domain-containing protein [Pontibacter qinzhouensis]TXK24831.1 AAA family ATPase [Pontibacter qinzhouensis]
MDVLKEFQAAIEIELAKNLQDFEEQKKTPLDERVAKGVTMTNLRVEFDFYDGLPNQWCYPLSGSQKYISSVKIFCDNNISKFKEGSSVVLSNGSHRFEMDIEEDSTENFILKPNDFNVKHCCIDSNNYPKNNWDINSVNTDISTKLLKIAADILKNNETTLRKIDSILNGRTRNNFQAYSQRIGYLNDSQNSAYLNAINASDFCIIQGPPGTGKTETIGNIAKQLIDCGLKVFVTAPTHTAINNCLNAVASKVKDNNKVIKIGEKASNKEVQENQYVTKKSRVTYSSYINNTNYSQKGIAIGSTAYSLCYPGSKKLDGWEFDVCIIDEASQLSIPLSIAAMNRTGKYIFVGDHKQLDPIIPKDSNNEMFAESIFSKLARIYPNEINLLNTSYRLNKSLIKIPNTLFYENQLQSASSTQEDNSRYECKNHPEILNSDPHKLILHNVFDANGRSPHEAKLVAELVSDLLQNGVKINDIGIMSPYRAQVREIKKEVIKVLPKTISKPFETLFVDTVDSMQGQERNYIIYSLANSHPLESMRRLDFFYSPNRLNVAITRAIKKCFVIANYKVFEIIDDELKDRKEYQDIKDSLDVFKRYFSLSTKFEINQTVEDEW